MVKKADGSRVTVSSTSLFVGACVVLVIGFVLGTRSGDFAQVVGPLLGFQKSSQTIDLSSVQNTFQYLKANFDGTLNTQALLDGANHGLVEAAGDKYTVYLDPKEAAALNNDLNGDIGGGIGAEIGLRLGQPTIVRVLPNNPAADAGLKAGDIITSVNDTPTTGWTAEKTVDAIRGKEGTTIKVTVKRGTSTLDFTITRALVKDPSVSSKISDGIGILTISRFDGETGALARQAAQTFVDQHVKGVVLDLRDDGGGYIDGAVDVASLWLDKDKTVVTQRKDDKVVDERHSSGDPLLHGLKTVVVVNQNTASASEILSSALKDYGVATLLGEKTFGKGTAQEVLNLGNGAQLKVTVARWYTPKGININHVGITPDKIVALTQADSNKGDDPQLAAALAELK